MELARQEYPALLAQLEPEQAVEVLNRRVSSINHLHTEIANWLQERRKVEEQYAASLRRLNRRVQEGQASALGVFQTPWQRIVNSAENMAQSHETFAAKIQADVETPLRQYSTTNRELASMGNTSGNLASLAKELASARKKAQKLDAKGSSKVDGAHANVDDATSQWESQAPFVFEQLQALDEARVNHLRDVLTQYQTHELDQVERVRASAESCLNALLNVETADEIHTFAAKAKEQAATTSLRRDSLPTPSRPVGGNLPPTPPPPRNATVDPRHSSIASSDRLAPLPEPPKEKKLSGLKRLGTVMGRRKSAAPPPVPAEKKKERTRSFAPFRRQESSRSFQDYESPARDLTPATSRDDRLSSRREGERPPQTQESRTSDATVPPALNGTTSIPTAAAVPTLPPGPVWQQALVPESNAGAAPSTAAPAGRTSEQPDLFLPAADPTASPLEDAARNFEIKEQPIHEDAGAAQAAMDNMANQLRMQAQSSGLNRVQGSVRGRRDVRNTMFIASPSQHEVPSPVGSLSTPVSATTAPAVATAATSADALTPAKRSGGSGTSAIPEDPSQTSDTHSVHSAHSTVATAHHTEMTGPGLNASLVEIVNTWLSDTGVTRSFVVGEIALAYNRAPTSSADHEIVRLQNFHQLEKCAQNPQFVTPSASDDHQPGTYNVALSSISRSLPTVAFKYQLHLDAANLSASSPLLITQAWQIVAGQASVILLYSLNPAFAPIAHPGTSPPPPPQELALKNVSMSVSLDTKPSAGSDATSPKAVSAQMMPVHNAHFKKRSSAVVWRFPELVVRPTQERLLVRFVVENNAMAKRGGVDLKFEAHNTLASALGVERLAPGGRSTDPATDPFADEDEARRSAEGATEQKWEDIPNRKMLVSGKYSAI